MLRVQSGGVPDVAAAVRPCVRGRALVALGGGRVIDSAKAIAGADGLCCAAVPTTLSGAELTGFHRMPAGAEGGAQVRPALVVADPALMTSQPARDRAASAINALAHAMEALYVPLANPVAEMSALRAARLLADGLGGAGSERHKLALGSLLAAYATGAAGYAVHHVVCQTLVRLTGAPHAPTHAAMLAHSAGLMAPRAPLALGQLADALGTEPGHPELAAGRIRELTAGAGATTLSQLGVEASALRRVAAAAAAGRSCRTRRSRPARRCSMSSCNEPSDPTRRRGRPFSQTLVRDNVRYP